MRLTLRTLLAYIDDILEPKQTKEIGEKIAESGFATTLMNRIREVMRRRRLTAPELEGPGSGLDPNVVAEYLDNVLPPEKVPDVEKVCLESDVHLAEVGACHQILTAALGEPVQILHKSREHMYALGPVTNPPSTQAKESVARTNGSDDGQTASSIAGQQVRAIAETPAAETGTEFENSIPEFLRRTPWWKRAVPYVAVGLVAAIWLGLLSMGGNLPFGLSGRDVTSNNSGARLDGQVAKIEGGGAPFAQTGIPLGTGNATQQPPETDSSGSPFGDEPIDPPPPKDDEGDRRPVVDAKPPGDLTLPAVPAPVENPPANAPAPKVAVVAPEPKPAVDPVPPAVNAPVLKYNSPKGILLRYDETVEDWMVMAPRAIVHAGERFVAPEPFDAVIDIGDGDARATLIGGSSVRVLPPTQAASVGFGIELGRLMLQPLKMSEKEGEEKKPVVLAIAVRNELWRVELLTPDTLCGIEILSVPPSRPDQEFGDASYVGRLYVATGSVRFADGTGKIRLVSGAHWRSLTPSDRAAEDIPDNAAGPPLLKSPDWLDPVARQSRDRTVLRAGRLFQREFDADRPLTENVHQLIKDDRHYISELAVKCLALAGDYAAATDGLSAAHEESRVAAIEGLRNWLPIDKGNGELLAKAVQGRFPNEEAEIVQRLLWGYTEADAMNRATSDQLIGWLDHSNLTIREMAFYHIYKLTGTKYDYLPMRSATQRRAAIYRWEERVKMLGALVGPPPN